MPISMVEVSDAARLFEYQGGEYTELKIAIIGCGATGRRSLIDRMSGFATGNNYVRWYDPTLEAPAEILRESHFFINGEPVKLKWRYERDESPLYQFYAYVSPDETGSVFPQIRTAEYLQNAELGVREAQAFIQQSDACIFMYRCISRSTFELIRYLVNQLFCTPQRTNGDMFARKPFWLVANMTDRPQESWEVPLAEAKTLSDKINAIFRTMSTRTGEGMDGFEQAVARCVLRARGGLIHSGVSTRANTPTSSLSGNDSTLQLPSATVIPSERRSKIKVAILGAMSTGRRSLMHRINGKAQGSDYIRSYYLWNDDAGRTDTLMSLYGKDVTIAWRTCHVRPYREPPEDPLIDRMLESPAEDRWYAEGDLQRARELLGECDACIFIYDCAFRRTFEHVRWLWNELFVAQRRLDSDIRLPQHIWVFANRIERPLGVWEASLLDGEELSDEIGATFRPVSTRTGEGTSGVDYEVARHFVKNETS